MSIYDRVQYIIGRHVQAYDGRYRPRHEMILGKWPARWPAFGAALLILAIMGCGRRRLEAVTTNPQAHKAWVPVVVFLILAMMGCRPVAPSSPPAAPPATPPPPLATVHFFNADPGSGQITWLAEQATSYGASLHVNGIYALDKETAFLFGGIRVPAGSLQSLLLRTEDGGKQWVEVMSPLPGSEVQQISFANAEIGWALVMWTVEGPGDVVLYRTADNGRTWQKVTTIPKTHWSGYPLSMHFSSAQSGQIQMRYDSGVEPAHIAILSSEDGGASWRETGTLSLENATAIAQATAGPETSPYESTGPDGTVWRVQTNGTTPLIKVSQQQPGQSGWTLVSILSAEAPVGSE